MKTARFLAEQIRRLHEARIRVFIIRGNHDALSRITKELGLPDSVTVFGGRADTIAVDRSTSDTPIAIHGLSFAQPQAPESLVRRYKPPVEGAVNIGLMHTSLAGSPGHDHYAPCSVADLNATGFRYWALGHVHKRAVVDGRCTIVMSGMPQGRDINEAGAKSVTLVTIGDDQTIRSEERVTSVAQFERLTIDATGIDDWRVLVRTLGEATAHARGGIVSDHLVARLRLVGATPLAWRMLRDRDLLKAEADEAAGRIGTTWIEALEVACRPPERPAAATAGIAADPVGELHRLIDEEIIQSEAFHMEGTKILDELRSQLPHECRALLGSDDAAFRAMLAQLAAEGSDEVLARLQVGAEADVFRCG